MKKTIRDIDTRGKRILLRVDLNAPLDHASGKILDDSRIRAIMPTIDHLQKTDSKIIIGTHLGRPKGRHDPDLSTKLIEDSLSSLTKKPVKTVGCCDKGNIELQASSLGPGELLLLENLRFHPEEEANDDHYAKSLSLLGDIYVNDAFAVSHRSHASIVAITRHMPSVAGLLLDREISFLEKATLKPARPYAAIIGGAKISTKIGVIENLLGIADKIMIGGGIANTFLAAEGFDIGNSLIDADFISVARDIMNHAQSSGTQLLLPTDVIVTKADDPSTPAKLVSIKDVTKEWQIVDIGRITVNDFAKSLEECQTVAWNGPMGVIEVGAFAHGSHLLAGEISKLKAITILGGGETALIAKQLGIESNFSHISTGGGACLEFLEGKGLPGLEVLPDKA